VDRNLERLVGDFADDRACLHEDIILRLVHCCLFLQWLLVATNLSLVRMARHNEVSLGVGAAVEPVGVSGGHCLLLRDEWVLATELEGVDAGSDLGLGKEFVVVEELVAPLNLPLEVGDQQVLLQQFVVLVGQLGLGLCHHLLHLFNDFALPVHFLLGLSLLPLQPTHCLLQISATHPFLSQLTLQLFLLRGQLLNGLKVLFVCCLFFLHGGL
jgi:hypothetical protein